MLGDKLIHRESEPLQSLVEFGEIGFYRIRVLDNVFHSATPFSEELVSIRAERCNQPALFLICSIYQKKSFFRSGYRELVPSFFGGSAVECINANHILVGIIRKSERQGYVPRLRSIHIYNKYQVIIQKHQLFFCGVPLSLDTQRIDSDIDSINTLHALAIHK